MPQGESGDRTSRPHRFDGNHFRSQKFTKTRGVDPFKGLPGLLDPGERFSCVGDDFRHATSFGFPIFFSSFS
jgi:hypothetical protein